MDAAREDRLERLFEEASAVKPEQRDAFLQDACAGDSEVRSKLEDLLTDAAGAGDFVDRVVGPVVFRYASVLLGNSPSADEDTGPRVGDDVGHFRVIEKLGGGGMGVVYKALDVRLGRPVALKCLPARPGADDAAKRRFIHEAKAASALDHPNTGLQCGLRPADEGRAATGRGVAVPEVVTEPHHRRTLLWSSSADGRPRSTPSRGRGPSIAA